MDIEVKRYKVRGRTYYRADCLDLPGTPPVGVGASQAMAMAHLMRILLSGRTGGSCSKAWSSFLDHSKPIWINGRLWKAWRTKPSTKRT